MPRALPLLPIFCLLALLCLTGCGEGERKASRGTRQGAATGEPAGGGGVDDPFAEADADPAESAAQVGPEHVWFRGRVEASPAILEQLPSLRSTWSVYVNAGHPPKGRPPVLSRRFNRPTFPFEFMLRQKDLAFGDTTVSGELVFYLVLSESGYVLADEGLYFKTRMSAPHAPGSSGLVLRLERP